MKNNFNQTEVYLQPGDFYFGDQSVRISTLLGSCVAITLWHPKKRIGGMCHYMLPSSPIKANLLPLDGKYAEDVMKMFINEIQTAGTNPSEYQAKVFGGGQMFGETVGIELCSHDKRLCIDLVACQNVACKNAYIAHFLLRKHGFRIVGHDLGGTDHRKVIFEVGSGDVWLRRGN